MWLDRPIQNKGRLEGINVGADVCKYVDAFNAYSYCRTNDGICAAVQFSV